MTPVEPSVHVIWVGSAPPPTGALQRVGIAIETMAADASAEELATRAPDLVVLAGEAAARAAVLEAAFARHPLGAALSIVVLEGEGPESAEPSGRGGVVARLGGATAPERMAESLASIVRRLALPVWDVALPRAMLATITARLGDDGLIGLVVSEEPPLVIAVGDRLELPPSGSAPVLRVSPRPRGRVRMLAATSTPLSTEGHLRSAPIAVLGGAGDEWVRLAEGLRAGGAEVELLTGGVDALGAARALDPALVVVDADLLRDPAATMLADDPRLASSPLLVATSAVAEAIDLAALRARAGALVAHELEIRARLERGELVVDRIEALGPARWLKAVGRCCESAMLELRSPEGIGKISIVGGKVREASFAPREPSPAPVTGRAAIQAMLAVSYGTMLAGPREVVALGRPELPRPPAMVAKVAKPEAVTPAESPKTAPKVEATTVSAKPVTVAKPAAAVAKPAVAVAKPAVAVAVAKPALAVTKPAPVVAKPAPVAAKPELTVAKPEVTTAKPEVAAAKPEVPAAKPEVAAAVQPEVHVKESDSARATDRSSTTPDEATPELGQNAAAIIDAGEDSAKVERAAPASDAERAELEPAEEPETDDLAVTWEPVVDVEPAAPEPARTPAEENEPPRTLDATPIAKATDAAPSPVRSVRTPPTDTSPKTPASAEVSSAAPKAPASSGSSAPRPRGWPHTDVTADAAIGPPDATLRPEPAARPRVGVLLALLVGVLGAAFLIYRFVGIDTLDETRGSTSTSTVADAGGVAFVGTHADAGEPREIDAGDPGASTTPVTSPPAGDIAARLAAAEEAIDDRHFEQAAELAQSVLAESPRNARAAYYLASSHLRRRQRDEALEWALHATEWDPQDPLPRLLLGDIYRQFGRRPSARRVWQQCVDDLPRFEPCQRRIEELDALEGRPAP